jgi:hypothetical protein
MVANIGSRPQSLRKRSQNSNEHRAWRRAALALDDYRRHAGDQAVESEALAHAPADPEGRRLHQRAVAALDDLARERESPPCRDLHR